MISVCMAVYNGSEYLKEQLVSILKQISFEDEVIIIDDNSKDSSVEVIQSLNDKRIKLFCNKTNIGVIRSFERALNKSSGEVIFLCDQDDVWVENKVNKTLNAFLEYDCDLICTDAFVTNEHLNIIKPSFFKFRKSGPGFLKNFIKNTFLGCTLAFKRQVLKIVLPFPRKIPMHDTWIGLIISLTGKVLFLDERLTYYRRHEKNVTGLKTSNGFFKIAVNRIKLLVVIITRLVSNKFIIGRKSGSV